MSDFEAELLSEETGVSQEKAREVLLRHGGDLMASINELLSIENPHPVGVSPNSQDIFRNPENTTQKGFRFTQSTTASFGVAAQAAMRDNPVALVYGYTPYEESTYDTYRGLRAWVMGGTSTYDEESGSTELSSSPNYSTSTSSSRSSSPEPKSLESKSPEPSWDEAGAARLEEGDYRAALRCYSEALEEGRTAHRFAQRARW